MFAWRELIIDEPELPGIEAVGPAIDVIGARAFQSSGRLFFQTLERGELLVQIKGSQPICEPLLAAGRARIKRLGASVMHFPKCCSAVTAKNFENSSCFASFRSTSSLQCLRNPQILHGTSSIGSVCSLRGVFRVQ
jgi:hypothetical protein